MKNKKFKKMRNTNSEKWFLVITSFCLINILGIITASTNYIKTLSKNNSLETMQRVFEIVKPLKIGKDTYYFYLPKWNVLLSQTPKLKNNLLLTIISFFFFSLFSLIFLAKKRVRTSQGAGRFGTYDDLKAVKKGKERIADINMLSDKGIVIGEVGKKLLHENSNTHIALVIPTRGGKGIGYIIPTLVEGWVDESVLVNDIKKENYELSAGYRAKEMGQIIYKFEPLSDLSNKYNPLNEIRFESEKEIEDCRSMGMTIVGEVKGNDPFWDTEAMGVISSMIMYVYYKKRTENPRDPKRATLTDATRVLTNPNNDIQGISRNYLGIDEDGDPVDSKDFRLSDEMIAKLKKIYQNSDDMALLDRGLHPFIANQFGYIANISENTIKSIVATAKSKLSVFELPTVAKNLEDSDFRIIDLMNNKKAVSLYLVVKPKDLELLAPLLRVFVVQVSDILTENLNGKKHKLLMLLDEFPALGKMSKIETGLGFYAGFRIKLLLIFQGLDQLTKIYGKENGILSGCQTQIYGRPNDNDSAKFISETLGTETIITKSRSRNTGLRGGGSTSTSEMKRELMTVGEVKTLPTGKAITITGVKPPLLLDKVLYFERKDLLERTKYPPVFFRKNKVIFEPTEEDRMKYNFREFEVSIEEFSNTSPFDLIKDKWRK